MDAIERATREDRAERAGAGLGAPAPHPSRARTVTFFEDRAEVVRVARVPVTAGPQRVAIGGVSLFVDDRAIEARVAEPARVRSASVRWILHGDRELGREAIEALEQEERAATDRVRAADLALDRAARREAQAGQLLWQWTQSLATVPRGAHLPEVIDRWRAALDALDASAAEARKLAHEARAERMIAADDRRRAAARLAEGRRERPRAEAVIEVELDAPAPGEIDLELTYRVAGALWRPEHLARLGEGGAVDLTTWAAAWQLTGERWEDVTARFSTARPARVATPPRLTDDVLSMQRKAPEDRKRVLVEVRDQTIAAAGLDRGARAVDEMPGVDDGGEPLVLEALHPVTLPSDGRPFRVEVARRALQAEVALVLYPELHPAAHQRATLTNTAASGPALPLLAGPVRLARGGSLVGRGRLGFVGAGEPFELGFGTDDAVRVRRAVEEERDTSLLGAQRLRRKITIYLSNLSGSPKQILVTERIPVSEVAQVEVTLVESPGFTLDKDGFLRGRFDLAPSHVRTLSFTYEIKAASGAVLPF